MQHKANFLNNSLFFLLLLGLLGITSCNTVTRLNVNGKDENENAPAPQHRSVSIDRGVSIEFEEEKGPALGDTPDDKIKKIVELMKGEGTHVGTGSTALHYLALSDEVYSSSDYKQIVRLLVNQRADINVKDNGGWTPLHIAVSNKNDALVKALISSGADLTIKDESGWTPLHRAVSDENYALVKALISSGADLTIKDENNKTAYAIAEDNEDQDTMDLLYRERDRREKLHSAIWKVAPCLKEIERLIALGVCVDAKDRTGNTPLHWASGNGHADVVKLLINAGADINAKNKDGDTALHRARENNHANVVELLIKEGAKVGVRNKKGEAPLSWAVDKGHTKVVNMLLDKDKELKPLEKLGLMGKAFVNSMHIRDEEERKSAISRHEMWLYRE